MNNKIPYQLFGNQKTKSCLFLHGNGFPPLSYKAFLNNLSSSLTVYAMCQRPFWGDDINPNSIHDWNIFTNDALNFIKQNNLSNTIGIGHSMGAVIILLIEMAKPGTFDKIFLLDPVITSRFKSAIYKILVKMNLIDKVHPMIKITNKKRIKFKSKNSMYRAYRNKNIFSKIEDDDLMCYINSIIKEENGEVKIKISKKWENTIYRTGSIHDSKIWRNINKIKIPTYVILPEENQFEYFHYGSKLKEKNKNIKNFLVNNSTHLFPIERSKNTSDLILDKINI